MVQEVEGRDVLGSVGRGFAQGLSEQLPKEIERYRLSSGLKKFSENASNLTPMQQLAHISGIPGISPQMIQSFGELAKQQARGQALNQGERPTTFPMPEKNVPQSTTREGIPSITQEKPLEKIQEGYIPPTQDQIIEDAGRRYNENPALYGYDPQRAIDAAETAALREEKIQESYQRKHENLSKIQDNVVNRLKAQSEKLNVAIPSNIYSRIEDKAIQATKPKSQGGEGLTEQQAMKKYGDELDAISRDYSKIDQIGNWGLVGRPAKETLRSLKGLQENFEKRGDTENFADTLISENKLSPKMAYAIAEPVYRVSEAAKYVKSLPELEVVHTLAEDKTSPEISIPKTLKIASNLASLLKNNEKLSPLALAYEIEKKGYDAQTFLQYVTDHKKELNLRQNQIRQLDTPNNLIGTFNDWWLSSWTGL